jgi:uncharacterized protein with von Willebrand factor type A (vWA) domain
MNFLANLLLFTHTLRRAGLTVSTGQGIEAAQALELIDLASRDQVYYAMRSLLLKRKEDIPVFDVIFNRFWCKQQPIAPAQKTPLAPRHNPAPPQPRATIVTLMAERAKQTDPAVDVADKTGAASAGELLQHKPFGLMTGEELAAVQHLISEMRWQVSWRKTHRRTADPRGARLHLRRMLRDAAKFNGATVELAWQSRTYKRRPLLLLADISGSMEKYSRILLQFAYALTHSMGGYGASRVESFVFGTRLSRITNQLAVRNIDVALRHAGGAVLDWAGGTRIGDCLERFNIEWSRRILRRGAIVLIVSDGCDCGEIETLRRSLRYLHHRCHRLIWLNPLAGDPRYQPLVAGMAAALPFIDDFMPIYNLQSLHQLSRRLGEIRN